MMAILVKVLAIRSKRQQRDGMFRIFFNSVFCFVVVLCVVFLALFIINHVRNMLSEDYKVLADDQIDKIKIRISSATRMGYFGHLVAPRIIWHSMTDEQLMMRASMSPSAVEHRSDRSLKVAFMFLVRGRLPLGPIWEKFFKGHDNLYSIYLHSSHGHIEVSNSSVFYQRMIPSKVVEWGKASMIDAERRLLANALLELSNQRFILLSETCIPLYNFTTIYNYLIISNYSFLSSFDDPRPRGRGRYNKRMLPTITISDWRKGSQWFEVDRKLALEIISDKKYYPIFRDHCNPPCYVDEHYLATLVTKLHPGLNSNRTITWVDWSTGGSHPKTFTRKDISEEFLNRIRHGSNCTCNDSVTSVCFLFARKFHPSTLEPLLRITPALYGFDS